MSCKLVTLLKSNKSINFILSDSLKPITTYLTDVNKYKEGENLTICHYPRLSSLGDICEFQINQDFTDYCVEIHNTKCEAGHGDTCHVSGQAAITGKRPSKNVTVG